MRGSGAEKVVGREGEESSLGAADMLRVSGPLGHRL